MSNFWNSFLQQIGTGDQIKDYRHASRTFVDGLYRLSPKVGTLFHVFIDLNTVVARTDSNSQIEIGMLAKSVQLPKYTINTKTYNAYNRKNIAQEKITYDPVSFTFHDDSEDVLRKFWQGYYSYYYRDNDHQLAQINQEHKYKTRQQQSWGFSPKGSTAQNYISSIRIYSLHQKRFSSCILVHPTITAFSHGQHSYGNYEGMEHNMTVAYESVQYESGQVSGGTVLGFGDIHYDRSPSPLSSLGGGTTSILGPGGLVEGGSDVITNLQNGNFLGAALGGLRTANNFKNTNLKTVASAELTQLGTNILRGQNPLSTVFVPTASSVNAGLSKAVSGIPGLGGITNSGNMNSQNNQLPSSNQGRIDL